MLYSLAAPFQRDDLNYFDIQPESGWIFLKKPLDVSLAALIVRLLILNIKIIQYLTGKLENF